ncbi:hypothetical protein ACFE04_024972 [Oxalis oulophora]
MAEEEVAVITMEEVETTINTNTNTNTDGKREREENKDVEEEEEVNNKKAKMEEDKKEEEVVVKLGPKRFGSSIEMFDYLFKFLHYWPTNVDLNKFEHMVLLDLLNKGHEDHAKKIGTGVRAFQVRHHPMWKSKCFFLIRDDQSADDFSFRKCVHHILPLPQEMMKPKTDTNKASGGAAAAAAGRGGKFGRGGRGRGSRGFN